MTGDYATPLIRRAAPLNLWFVLKIQRKLFIIPLEKKFDYSK